MLSAFTKIVKPIVPKFSGNPLEYSKFKVAFKVEVDKKEVYDATDKLKSLLDAEKESAKSWLVNSCQVLINIRRHGIGRVDTVVSAAKRREDQFPITVKENS